MRTLVLLAAGILIAPGPLWAGDDEVRTTAQAVDAMIRAHGGMEAWRSAPTAAFTDSLVPAGMAEGQALRVVVDQRSRRAYIDVVGTEVSLAWDGEKAWGINWGSPVPPRFLALLNYYFLNLPWVVKDPGVILGDLERRTLWDDPTRYLAVRVTFEPGTGDTPDDYYVLFIHPETHRLAGCEYIVTYAGVLPPGMEQSPPHTLLFEEFETENGLLVPVRYTIYNQDHSVYATCSVRDWSFSEPFDESRMTMPENGVLDTSRPSRETP